MNDLDFPSFCYDEYKRSLTSADDIYRRYPLAVTAIVILATATIALGSNEYLPHFLDRVDVTLYYAGLGVALASIACGTILLMISIFPKDYEHLDSPFAFHKWREAYRADLLDKGYSAEVVTKQVEVTTAHRDDFTRPHPGERLQPDHGSDLRRDVWKDRTHMLLVNRSDRT